MLDHVVDEMASDAPQGATKRFDYAGGDRRLETERTAYGDDKLANAQLRGWNRRNWRKASPEEAA